MKLLSTLFISALLFISNISFAQEKLYDDGVFQFENGKKTYVFNDQTRVREKPATTARIIDSLRWGTEIEIKEKTTVINKMNGKSASWYKISYLYNDLQKEGFIWGGNLCITPMRRGNIKFLFGLKGTYKKEEHDDSYDIMVAELRAIQQDTLISAITYNIDSPESLSFGEGKIENPPRLAGAQYLVHLTVSGEACGIPIIEQQVVWTGKKLIKLPICISVGDADIYSHDETFIFSNAKNGQTKQFIKSIKEYEKDEETGKEKRSIKKEYFIWTGDGFIKK